MGGTDGANASQLGKGQVHQLISQENDGVATNVYCCNIVVGFHEFGQHMKVHHQQGCRNMFEHMVYNHIIV